MAEFDQGVTPESPAGTEVQGGAPSAETLNTGTPAPPPQHTVPYERFHEVNTGYRQASARAAAAEQAAALHQQQLQQAHQRLQSLEGQLQQRAQQVPRTPQEAQERQAALQALRSLQSDDPDYVRLQQTSQALPALAQAMLEAREQIATLKDANFQTFSRGEQGRLYQMASAAGLTFQTPQQFGAFEDYVAGIIRSVPQAHAAFVAGDPRIMPWALQRARQEVVATQQAARAGLTQTKNLTQRLPPRIGGSTPGSPPVPKFDPKDPRGSMAKIHAGAEAYLQSQLG